MEDVQDAAGAYVAVAALDELRPGFVSVHEVEGRGIVLALTDAGVTAWDGTCPHADFQFGPMRLRRGCVLECPMHGAQFDVGDGHVLKGPATEPLEPIDIRVEDGTVFVRVDWLL